MPEDSYAYVVATFQAPPSPDYVPGSEEPEQAPPSFVYVPYVPEPVYPEFMPPKDEILPSEEQPLPAAISPTTQSPGYVLESNPEEDPEEDDEDPADYPTDRDDDEEDPEEDPADYPTDGGDDGDDEDESSDEDEDDEDAPPAEETEPFETDESAPTPPPHPAYRVTARISIQDEPPIPFWSDAEIDRLLVILSPPLPQIPSPPLPESSPVPVLSPSPPASPIRPLGYRAAMIRLRVEAASTSYSLPLPPLLPIPAPTSSPPLLLPSTNRREDRPEVTLPPRKRLGIALGPWYEVGMSSSAAAARLTGGCRADYGLIATLNAEIRRDLKRYVGYRITDS
ncbi:hypothetical protein Tco_1305836 [Tanacetum coccineum]